VLPRITIHLPEEVRVALDALSKREERDPRIQAVRLLRDGLAREGVLPPAQPEPPARPARPEGNER
jgi:hypothetical protein